MPRVWSTVFILYLYSIYSVRQWHLTTSKWADNCHASENTKVPGHDILLSSAQRWLRDQTPKPPENDQVSQKKKSRDSLPDLPVSSCPTVSGAWRPEWASALIFSPPAWLHPTHQRPAEFSCHSPVLTTCQQHSDTFHRNSKCLTRLNKACLTWPLPTLISSLSSFHHPRHSFSSTNEPPAFPPNLCHILSCFHVLELCWEAPIDSTR